LLVDWLLGNETCFCNSAKTLELYCTTVVVISFADTETHHSDGAVDVTQYGFGSYGSGSDCSVSNKGVGLG
jgi:hypothetical protein